MSAPALQLLQEIEKDSGDSDFLFPGRKPDSHLQEIKFQWADICKAAKLRDFRVHDLRHTYASTLANAGISLQVIGRLLGHTQPATTHRYAHLYDDPLREATERVGAVVTAATTGKTAKVVQLRGDKK